MYENKNDNIHHSWLPCHSPTIDNVHPDSKYGICVCLEFPSSSTRLLASKLNMNLPVSSSTPSKSPRNGAPAPAVISCTMPDKPIFFSSLVEDAVVSSSSSSLLGVKNPGMPNASCVLVAWATLVDWMDCGTKASDVDTKATKRASKDVVRIMVKL